MDKEEKHKAFFESVKKEVDPEELRRKHEAFFSEGDEDFFKKYSVRKETEPKADEEFFLNTDRSYVIKQVKKNGLHLQKAPMFENDAEIVTLAVENTAKAFEYASISLRTNIDFVKLLIEIKQTQIEEAKLNKNDALIVILQQEIEELTRIHQKALEEKQNSRCQYMGMSM